MSTQEFKPIAIDEFGTSKPDDFDATVVDSYAAIHKSQKGKYGLYVDTVLKIDGMDELWIERDYLDFLGNQQGTRINLAPSKDGKTFAGGASEEDLLALVTGEGSIKEEEEIEYTGPYVIGTATKLRSSNHSQRVISIKRLFPDPENSEDVNKTTFEPLNNPQTKVRFDYAKGHKFHWQRLPQDAKRKSNKDKEGSGDQGDFTVLCATAYLGTEDVSAVNTASGANLSKPVASQTQAPVPAPAATNGDLSPRVESEVLTVLGNLAAENKLPIKRALINANVVKNFAGSEMGGVLALLNNESYMGSDERPWKLTNGMLSLG